MATNATKDFAFYEELRAYYTHNSKAIRRRYNDLTKKFLAYNDYRENPTAYLRAPQFEALEMYVFIKEFMDNAQVYEMFDDWRHHRGSFSDTSSYSLRKGGQTMLWDSSTEQLTDTLFKQMKKYKEDYPNYIYALTMGLGKTILMATCIFYEFLLANKYPKDKRFCHNALVFAPDKTVLQSLREIITFDKTKIVPPEYVKVLAANIKFHFLEDSGTTLHTLDDSDFNIIISNTQKIIVKKKRIANKPADIFFNQSSLLSQLYGSEEGDEDVVDDSALIENQRYKKLCRLNQLGVYVDEAHHLFGADLEKQIHATNSNKTSLRDTINMLAKNTTIVASYNYTGTPYINKQLLPEVVYAYGLKESIQKGFLKEVSLKGFEHVKSEEFIRTAVTTFWSTYGNQTFEDLPPKLAIFASTIDEATDEVAPLVEKILAELNIPSSKILINVGDEKITKNEDIHDFNNLDVPGTAGSKKQIIILVGKGREGWNCRSLFGVAMFRSPKSKVFVLQATMRCLRKITTEQLTATVFLSKENYLILDDELNKNFNMDIGDLTKSNKAESKTYNVRVIPPPKSIRLNRIWREYTIIEKCYDSPVDFKLSEVDFSKYAATMYEKDGISRDMSVKVKNIDHLIHRIRYSSFSLVGEIARYLNISCLLAAKILRESKDGEEEILKTVNKYNEVLNDVIIPRVFHTLFEVNSVIKTGTREIVLLREPKDREYYPVKGRKGLVLTHNDPQFTATQIAKSFHADTYCFDSKPEKECFLQYITSDKVKKIYFTGMFTSNQGDLSIQYYDQDSKRIRQYYPDFFAEMADGTYHLIEVKGDNMLDNTVVQAKADAATIMATHSDIEYKIYPGSVIMKSHILEQNSLVNHKNISFE
jgi:hypothetical protein